MPKADLLAEARRLTFGILSARSNDPASLVRAWPRLAIEVHRANRAIMGADPDAASLIDRIAIDAYAHLEEISRQPWPGPGPSDLHLEQAAHAVRRAGDHHLNAVPAPHSQDDTRQILAAVLWAAAHAIARSANEFATHLQRDHGHADPVQRDLVVATAFQTSRRFQAVGQLAAVAAHGKQIRSPHNHATDDLRRAIATWDIEAHRALLSVRSTAVVNVICAQQSVSLSASEILLARARSSEAVDPLIAARLAPALRESSQSWQEMHGLTAELATRDLPIPRQLVDAADVLQSSFEAAAVLTQPTEQRDAMRVVPEHLASAVTIAASVRDLINDTELRAPAPAITQLLVDHRPHMIESPVNPVDVLTGNVISIPRQARNILAVPASGALLDASDALDCASDLATPRHPETPRMNASAETVRPRTPHALTPVPSVAMTAPSI